MSKSLQGHCTKFNKRKKREASTVSSRGQTTGKLHCKLQVKLCDPYLSALSVNLQ